ncbi:MAG: hypothetical protein JSR19_09605 [Proteobacteria bacterium]|nr:hypothetical protein [Pseudomonadota bacterium]HQR04093.1 hypothetical protein [Rhodocyclaceae bacterium]
MSQADNRWPAFFAEVPAVRLRDPLAALLGACEGGLIEYHYADAVKLAGHSCPTVAGAYGLTRRALATLYPAEVPERGGVRVTFAADQASGVTGVVANVVSLLTGAAGSGGFKGLGGRYVRRDLLDFAHEQPMEIRFERRDTGAAVDAAFHPASVPAAPQMAALLQACVLDTADAAQRAEFGRLWQDRVRRLLVDHAADVGVYDVRPTARKS